MKIEINVNDQLFVNNKWYFDILNINDNIVQVRVRYKENPNIENYSYKSINLDKSLFLSVDKDESSDIIKCNINEKELRKSVGTLLSRLKVEMDYSFIYEDVANSANTSGFGDVVMPGINPIPGQQGSAGSGDIGTTLPPSEKRPVTLGTISKKKRKKKKERKKIDNILKIPVIFYESFNILDDDIKTKFMKILDYPEKNDMDKLFIADLNKKQDDLLNSSKDVIQTYFKDLIDLNPEKFEECSVWLKNDIENIISYE